MGGLGYAGGDWSRSFEDREVGDHTIIDQSELQFLKPVYEMLYLRNQFALLELPTSKNHIPILI